MSAPSTGAATIILLGDVMLGRGVDAEWRAGTRADAFWGTVLPVLRSADGVFANLECAITAHGARWSRTPKVFHFRASPTTTAIRTGWAATVIRLPLSRTKPAEASAAAAVRVRTMRACHNHLSMR